jgi:hypothetical protein
VFSSQLLDSAKADVAALLRLRDSKLMQSDEFSLAWTGTPQRALPAIRKIAEELNRDHRPLAWLYQKCMERFEQKRQSRAVRNAERVVIHTTQIRDILDNNICAHSRFFLDLSRRWANERQWENDNGGIDHVKGMTGFHTFLMRKPMHSYALATGRPPMVVNADGGSFYVASFKCSDVWWMDNAMQAGASTES